MTSHSCENRPGRLPRVPLRPALWALLAVVGPFPAIATEAQDKVVVLRDVMVSIPPRHIPRPFSPTGSRNPEPTDELLQIDPVESHFAAIPPRPVKLE